jgi:hypothetical protein
MHGLHTYTLHNSETLEPLTWIRVRPSHCYKRSRSLSLFTPLSLVHICFVFSPLNISKYTTFKPITQLVLLYINLATCLTLTCSLRMQKMNAFSEPAGPNQGSFLQTKVKMKHYALHFDTRIFLFRNARVKS